MPTEWKMTGEDEGESCQPAGEDEPCADSAAHEDGVAKRPADGDVPVIGHGCEEEELVAPRKMWKKSWVMQPAKLMVFVPVAMLSSIWAR